MTDLTRRLTRQWISLISIIAIVVLLVVMVNPVNRQKIDATHYGNIDSFYYYKNAKVIVYKSNDIVMKDTLWFPLKRDIHIKEAGIVTDIYGDVILRRKNKIKL